MFDADGKPLPPAAQAPAAAPGTAAAPGADASSADKPKP
jgi:hypothetical protein